MLELLQRVGRGGMAEVFLARQLSPGGLVRQVIVKRALRHSAVDALHARLRAEARTHARLTHENIVQLYDLSDDEGGPWIVMEHVDGVDVRRVLRRSLDQGRIPPLPFAVTVALRVLRALHAAHACDVIHRDVTPSNVLLSRHGGVKLCDFGIALSATEDRITLGGCILGKSRYLAPEQLRFGSADERTDLYAVGLLLDELISGAPSFEGADGADLAKRIMKGRRDPLLLRAPHAPTELVAVVERAVRPDPRERWASAHEMAQALDAACRRTGVFECDAAVADAVAPCLCAADEGDVDDEATAVDAGATAAARRPRGTVRHGHRESRAHAREDLRDSAVTV